MATGKRYYWIKLKDSFMSSDEIDYLMSQPDGANYVVLYQMLCLKTINTNGCLVSKIGEMLIPYDAEKIQRECKWFPLSTVRLALTVYKQIGLIFENPDGTLSISDYQNMIGSETDWAAKNRRIRSNAANKELQEGHDTGHTSGHNVSSDGGENVPTEIEKDKDKEMDDLYFKFTVPFEDSEKLGTATIEAYNLSPATRNSIKKGMPIILNAGYEGDIGAIFTGKVSQVADKHSGTEVITTIAAAEALEEWLSKEVNKTYTAGSKASAIVKDLLNIFGLEVGTMELAVDKEYPRGKVCKGKVKNVLTEIVTSDCKSRFLIRNGIVTINDPKTGTKTGYVLSAESGLLQAAEATDRTETTTRQTTVKDGKEKQEVTYKRECLLNYHLAPADVVKIKSDTLNGNHLIKGGQHTGCPDGDWKTTIEVKPV